MNKLVPWCFGFFFLTSFAAATNLAEQRQLYSQVSVLQAQGKWAAAQQSLELMAEYPLTYLLEYQALKANFAIKGVSQVQTFINNNSDHRISLDLERDYLYYLATNNAWQEFLDFYPTLPNSRDLKCYHFKAKIKQNSAQAAWPAFKKMWLTGRSLPNACDDVIAFYRAKNKFSESLIWQRFKLAFEHDSRSLMGYLTTWMNPKNQILATQLYALHKKPNTLLNSQLFDTRKQASFPFLTTSIKRLARVDIDAAISIFNTYQDKVPFNTAESLQLKKYFTLWILLDNEVTKLPWLDKHLISLQDSDLIELRIRYAIKYDNWQNIEYWLNMLPAQLKEDPKWRYWQARVLENKQQQQQADEIYRKIANQRSYYSFLAVQKLDLDYQLNATLVSANSDSLKSMKAALAHIEELAFQKHHGLLKREWRALLNNNTKSTQLQLGLYAYQKDWAHLSILASINTKSWDALNIRFPEIKSPLFSNAANQYQIEAAYIYAITRQESAFDESAKSSAGASGYMQLMPATAKETAQMIGMKDYNSQMQLTNGEINVQLGTAYFDMLFERYNGNRILATAAYNAGPSRVDRWRASQEGRPEQGLKMDSWIEAIPYEETRNYVKNVLAYNVIYQHVLNKPRAFFNAVELDARY